MKSETLDPTRLNKLVVVRRYFFRCEMKLKQTSATDMTSTLLLLLEIRGSAAFYTLSRYTAKMYL